MEVEVDVYIPDTVPSKTVRCFAEAVIKQLDHLISKAGEDCDHLKNETVHFKKPIFTKDSTLHPGTIRVTIVYNKARSTIFAEIQHQFIMWYYMKCRARKIGSMGLHFCTFEERIKKRALDPVSA